MTRARCALALAIASVSWPSPASAQDRERCVAAFDEGQALHLKGELRAARASFLTCAADACPGLVRKDCAQSLSALDAELPTIVLGARDAKGNDVIPTAVTVDGESVATLDGRALAEDPGQHVIRFEHPPDAPVVEHVVLRVGEHNRTILATFGPPPAPPPVPRPVVAEVPRPASPRPEKHGPSGWAYVAAGFGVVGLGSFAAFGLSGWAYKQHLLDTCAPNCADSDVGRVRLDYIVADTSLGVGLVASAIATYLFLSSSSSSSPGSGLSVTPSRQGVDVAWAGRF
jgi:hypothetical protein